MDCSSSGTYKLTSLSLVPPNKSQTKGRDRSSPIRHNSSATVEPQPHGSFPWQKSGSVYFLHVGCSVVTRAEFPFGVNVRDRAVKEHEPIGLVADVGPVAVLGVDF